MQSILYPSEDDDENSKYVDKCKFGLDVGNSMLRTPCCWKNNCVPNYNMYNTSWSDLPSDGLV